MTGSLHAVRKLTLEQHGVISRSQALGCGYSDSAIGRNVAAGRWVRLYRGIYLVGLRPVTFETRLMALVLRAPGRAWASHRAAVALWGLEPDAREVVEITTTANLRRPRRGVYRVDAMPPRDRTIRSGIPVTSVERTLADLGAVIAADRLAAMVVEATRRGLTTSPALAARLADGALGRFGPPHLRKVLDDWETVDRAESRLEVRLRRLLRAAGLPQAIPQHEVGTGGRVLARVDLAYPTHKLAIEADGYRWHGGPRRWRSDLARRNALTRLGWQVLHFTWDDVENHPDRVVADISAGLARTPDLSESPAKREKTTGSPVAT